MTLTQQIITIAMVVLGTAVTRFLPFLIFPAGTAHAEIYPVSGEGCCPAPYSACWSYTA